MDDVIIQPETIQFVRVAVIGYFHLGEPVPGNVLKNYFTSNERFEFAHRSGSRVKRTY